MGYDNHQIQHIVNGEGRRMTITLERTQGHYHTTSQFSSASLILLLFLVWILPALVRTIFLLLLLVWVFSTSSFACWLRVVALRRLLLLLRPRPLGICLRRCRLLPVDWWHIVQCVVHGFVLAARVVCVGMNSGWEDAVHCSNCFRVAFLKNNMKITQLLAKIYIAFGLSVLLAISVAVGFTRCCEDIVLLRLLLPLKRHC